MRLTYDRAKNAANIEKRGLSFELVADLDWETAIVREDFRRDYGEHRMLALGFLGMRLHAAVVTYRDGAVHVISFRKASQKEVRLHDDER